MPVGKRGATALGFALLLRNYSRDGRFPRGRADLTDDVIEFVARQVGVDASELGLYEWSGRTTVYHRSQIRVHGLPVASSARTTIDLVGFGVVAVLVGVRLGIGIRDETTEVGRWRDLIVVRAEVAPRGVCTRRAGSPRRRR
ncbi:MAG: DUF4158 domain-containing protein [Dermatophilaceae bacterium]